MSHVHSGILAFVLCAGRLFHQQHGSVQLDANECHPDGTGFDF